MDFSPYNLNKLQELLDENKNFIESFFGTNPFGDDFLQRVAKGNVVGETNAYTEKKTETSNRSIPVDMIQRKYELLYIFEIPGLSSKEDVRIKVVDSTLIIEGHIKRNYAIDNKDKTKLERKIGKFSKRVTIPIIYDSKRIRARYNNGLLEVRLPILRQTVQDNITVQFN